mgnify:CR=1 FL=1
MKNAKKSVVDVTRVENEVLKTIVQVLLEEKNLFRANLFELVLPKTEV